MILASDVTATWVVAGATVALFVFTALLFWETKSMVKAATSEIHLEERRLAAGQRPHVYPVTFDPWVRGLPPYAQGQNEDVIPLANAGQGIAHNVTGILILSDGVFVPVIPLTIQPGQMLDASFDWGGEFRPEPRQWNGARGFLVYDDVAGETWVTEYYVRESNRGLFFDFETSGRLDEFGNLYTRYGLHSQAVVAGPFNRPLERALAQSSRAD